MPSRKISFAPGEYYHLYNRGNSKQVIFKSKKDYEHFVKLLYICNSKNSFIFRDDIVHTKSNVWNFDRGETLISIGAWVLMPNHFHIYVFIPDTGNLEENHISLFMRKLGVAYSKYFNAKYNRTGSLFEGRFKSQHVLTDTQSKYLFSYIHLNPLKLFEPKWREEGLKDTQKALSFLKNYPWSSYPAYTENLKVENKILNISAFPNYFQNKKIFAREIFGWLSFKNKDVTTLPV